MTYSAVRTMADDLSAKIRRLAALSVAVAGMASTIQSEDKTVSNVIVLAELAQDVAEEAEDCADAMLDAIESDPSSASV